MATEIANAYIALYTKMPGVEGDIKKSLGGVDATSAGEGVGKKFSAGIAGVVGGAMAAVTSKAIGAITGSINSAIARVDTINNFPKIMANLGYSSDEAATSIQTMSDRLTGLPTALNSMADMVQKLAPLTGGLGEATELSLALNNALLAGGKSTEVQANAMEQYSQMLALGKVDMAAWRSMVAAMPGQMDQLAVSLLGAGNKSMDLYEAMKNGTIGFDQFNAAVQQLNTEGVGAFASFEDQARSATGGIGTQIANMQTAITRGLANVIMAAEPMITTVIGGITTFINAIAPVVAGFVEGLVGLFSGIDLSAFVEIGASLSPLSLVFQTLAPLLPVIADAFAQIAATLGGALATVAATLVPILVQLAQVFAGALAQILPVLLPLLTMIAEVIAQVLVAVAPLVATLISGLMPVFSALVPVIASLLSAFMPIVEAILPPLLSLIEALAPIVVMLVEAFLPLLEPILGLIDPLLQMVGELLPPLMEFFGALVPIVVAVAQAILTFLIPVFQGVVSAISGLLIPVINMISDVLGGLIDFIIGVFTGDWERAWDGVVSIFSGIWNGLTGIVKGIVNGIIDIINGAISGINGIAGGVSDLTGGSISFTIPSIPKLAEGGIVRAQRGGILANIGEGRYDEAVVPLSPGVLKSLGGGDINQTVIFNESRIDPRVALREAGRELKAAGL